MAAEGGVKIDVEAPAAAAAEVGGGEPVQLHVYDISQGLAKELSAAFLGTSIDGIWHTGVSAFGSEYFYGAGIQRSSSGASPYGAPERVVNLGRTQVAKERLEAFLEGEEMSGRYTAATYDLLQHNCNHFSHEAAKFLGVAGVPEDILGLPRLVLDSPNRDLIMPLIFYIESTLKNGGAPHIPLDMTSLLAGLPPAPEAPAVLVKQPGTNGHLGPNAHAQEESTCQLNATVTASPSAGDIAASAASHRKIRNKAEFASLAETVLTSIENQQ